MCINNFALRNDTALKACDGFSENERLFDAAFRCHLFECVSAHYVNSRNGMLNMRVLKEAAVLKQEKTSCLAYASETFEKIDYFIDFNVNLFLYICVYY